MSCAILISSSKGRCYYREYYLRSSCFILLDFIDIVLRNMLRKEYKMMTGNLARMEFL